MKTIKASVALTVSIVLALLVGSGLNLLVSVLFNVAFMDCQATGVWLVYFIMWVFFTVMYFTDEFGK